MCRRGWLITVGMWCLGGLAGCTRTEEKPTNKPLPTDRLPPPPKGPSKR